MESNPKRDRPSRARSEDDRVVAEGRTTARGRRTRAALITAARDVFEQVGYRDARVADIASRAKTSYGSFYFYFDSKDDIFREVVKEYTGQMFMVSRAGVDGATPIERIAAANRAYLAAYAKNVRLMAVIEEASPYDKYFRDLMMEIRNLFVQRNETAIRRLQAQGLAATDFDAHLAASALGGMVERFAQVWLLMGEEHDESKVVDTLTLIWARGIGLSGMSATPEQSTPDENTPQPPAKQRRRRPASVSDAVAT